MEPGPQKSNPITTAMTGGNVAQKPTYPPLAIGGRSLYLPSLQPQNPAPLQSSTTVPVVTTTTTTTTTQKVNMPPLPQPVMAIVMQTTTTTNLVSTTKTAVPPPSEKMPTSLVQPVTNGSLPSPPSSKSTTTATTTTTELAPSSAVSTNTAVADKVSTTTTTTATESVSKQSSDRATTTAHDNEKLPPLVPQTTIPPRMRNCMQCDNKSMDVAQCTSSGLWFCDNDDCREQYRQEESAHFAQLVRKKATEAANANLRRSARRPKPLEIVDTPQPAKKTSATNNNNNKKHRLADEDHVGGSDAAPGDDDDNDRPRKAAKTSKDNKKRAPTTGGRAASATNHETSTISTTTSHSHIRLQDTLSTHLYRVTEDQKRALRPSNRIKLIENGKLDEVKKTRESLLTTYQQAIDNYNTYMDHLEQAMELWHAMRLAPDDRYDVFQEYLADTRARVEKLRTAYDAAEENYADEAISLSSGDQQPQHQQQQQHSHDDDNATNHIVDPQYDMDVDELTSLQHLPPSPTAAFLLPTTPSPPHSPTTQQLGNHNNTNQQQQPVALTPHHLARSPSTSPTKQQSPSMLTRLPDREAIIMTMRANHHQMKPQILESLFVDNNKQQCQSDAIEASEDSCPEPESMSNHDDDDIESPPPKSMPTSLRVSNNNNNNNSNFVDKLVTPVKVKSEPGLSLRQQQQRPSKNNIVLEISSEESEEEEEEEELPQVVVAPNQQKKKKIKSLLSPLGGNNGSIMSSYSPKKASLPRTSGQTIASRPMSEGKKNAIRETIQSLSACLEKDAAEYPQQQQQQQTIAMKTPVFTGGDQFMEISTIDDNIQQRKHQSQRHPAAKQKRLPAEKPQSLPRGAHLEANGRHKIWNTRVALSDKFMRDSDYRLMCKSPDGTVCFYVNQPEPVGGAFNQWIGFIETQWSVKVKTRADIVVICANGDRLSNDLLQRLISADAPSDQDDNSAMDAESDMEQQQPHAPPTRPPSTRQRNKKRGAPRV